MHVIQIVIENATLPKRVEIIACKVEPPESRLVFECKVSSHISHMTKMKFPVFYFGFRKIPKYSVFRFMIASRNEEEGHGDFAVKFNTSKSGLFVSKSVIPEVISGKIQVVHLVSSIPGCDPSKVIGKLCFSIVDLNSIPPQATSTSFQHIEMPPTQQDKDTLDLISREKGLECVAPLITDYPTVLIIFHSFSTLRSELLPEDIISVACLGTSYCKIKEDPILTKEKGPINVIPNLKRVKLRCHKERDQLYLELHVLDKANSCSLFSASCPIVDLIPFQYYNWEYSWKMLLGTNPSSFSSSSSQENSATVTLAYWPALSDYPEYKGLEFFIRCPEINTHYETADLILCCQLRSMDKKKQSLSNADIIYYSIPFVHLQGEDKVIHEKVQIAVLRSYSDDSTLHALPGYFFFPNFDFRIDHQILLTFYVCPQYDPGVWWGTKVVSLAVLNIYSDMKQALTNQEGMRWELCEEAMSHSTEILPPLNKISGILRWKQRNMKFLSADTISKDFSRLPLIENATHGLTEKKIHNTKLREEVNRLRRVITLTQDSLSKDIKHQKKELSKQLEMPVQQQFHSDLDRENLELRRENSRLKQKVLTSSRESFKVLSQDLRNQEDREGDILELHKKYEELKKENEEYERCIKSIEATKQQDPTLLIMEDDMTKLREENSKFKAEIEKYEQLMKDMEATTETFKQDPTMSMEAISNRLKFEIKSKQLLKKKMDGSIANLNKDNQKLKRMIESFKKYNRDMENFTRTSLKENKRLSRKDLLNKIEYISLCLETAIKSKELLKEEMEKDTFQLRKENLQLRTEKEKIYKSVEMSTKEDHTLSKGELLEKIVLLSKVSESAIHSKQLIEKKVEEYEACLKEIEIATEPILSKKSLQDKVNVISCHLEIEKQSKKSLEEEILKLHKENLKLKEECEMLEASTVHFSKQDLLEDKQSDTAQSDKESQDEKLEGEMNIFQLRQVNLKLEKENEEDKKLIEDIKSKKDLQDEMDFISKCLEAEKKSKEKAKEDIYQLCQENQELDRENKENKILIEDLEASSAGTPFGKEVKEKILQLRQKLKQENEKLMKEVTVTSAENYQDLLDEIESISTSLEAEGESKLILEIEMGRKILLLCQENLKLKQKNEKLIVMTSTPDLLDEIESISTSLEAERESRLLLEKEMNGKFFLLCQENMKLKRENEKLMEEVTVTSTQDLLDEIESLEAERESKLLLEEEMDGKFFLLCQENLKLKQKNEKLTEEVAVTSTEDYQDLLDEIQSISTCLEAERESKQLLQKKMEEDIHQLRQENLKLVKEKEENKKLIKDLETYSSTDFMVSKRDLQDEIDIISKQLEAETKSEQLIEMGFEEVHQENLKLKKESKVIKKFLEDDRDSKVANQDSTVFQSLSTQIKLGELKMTHEELIMMLETEQQTEESLLNKLERCVTSWTENKENYEAKIHNLKRCFGTYQARWRDHAQSYSHPQHSITVYEDAPCGAVASLSRNRLTGDPSPSRLTSVDPPGMDDIPLQPVPKNYKV